MWIYNKGDIVGVMFKKQFPTNVPRAKLGESSVTQHAVGIAGNKQVKGKILANRSNVHTEHIQSSKSWDSFLKCVKENDQKKKEAKRKVLGFNWSARLLPPEKHILWEPVQRSLSRWNPFYEFIE